MAAAKREYAAQRLTDQDLTSTRAEMEKVVTHLRDYWYAATITEQEQQERLRCLIVAVRLENQGKVLRAQVQWQGGTVTALDVPKYLFSTPAIYHRISRLAETDPDSAIATLPTAEGLTTATGKQWTARHVMDFRHAHAIPSRFTNAARLRVSDSTYLTSAEAAEQLGIAQTTVQKWYKLGLLEGKHAGGQSQLWIAWTEDVRERLRGQATPNPRLVSVRALCRTQDTSPEAVLAWAQAQGHTMYRLRRGTAMRFFILPQRDVTDIRMDEPPSTVPSAEPAGTVPAALEPAAAGVLAVLTPEPQAIRLLCTALGMSKQELEQVVAQNYDALIQAGMQPHVATKSEVAGAIRLPSTLNPQEYTYYSQLARIPGTETGG